MWGNSTYIQSHTVNNSKHIKHKVKKERPENLVAYHSVKNMFTAGTQIERLTQWRAREEFDMGSYIFMVVILNKQNML